MKFFISAEKKRHVQRSEVETLPRHRERSAAIQSQIIDLLDAHPGLTPLRALNVICFCVALLLAMTDYFNATKSNLIQTESNCTKSAGFQPKNR